MPFQDGTQVRASLNRSPNAESIATAYALSRILRTSTYSEDYIADSRWLEAIVPTTAGNDLLALLSTTPIPRPDLRLGLFGIFWFQELLVDASRSNLELAKSLIEGDALSGKIHWPISQGRLLYDRYAELFPDYLDSLRGEEILPLLAGTNQGVYQVGKFVTGPLGIVESQCGRYYPPIMKIGLWHCPMLDCGRLHPVNFEPPPIPLTEGYRLLQRAAVQLWTTPSRWEYTLATWPYDAKNAWRAYSEMPLFLGDCIVAEDRIRLLEKALSDRYADYIRTILKAKRSKVANGKPYLVATSLSTDEQMQLLLTLPDAEISTLIDELVRKREIEVPTAEIREIDPAKIDLFSNYFSAHFQLSSLGMRARRQNSVLLLRHLLWNAYLQNNETRDLDWRLRKSPETSTQDALMSYLRKVKPSTAIETIILTSPSVTKSVAESLGMTVDVPDENTRSILEWKLGFNLPREDRRLETIDRLIEIFYNTVLSISSLHRDADREAIRSTGVNLFAELEGFLDAIIGYIVWILCSDHPKITQFVYSHAAATMSVPIILGTDITTGSEISRWAINGNTLGTSVRYIQRLAEWLTELPKTERSTLLRRDDEIHTPTSDAVTIFPFNHVQLWADAAPDALAELTASVRACVDLLNKAEVAFIRNGIEHYREPHRFPTGDRLLTASEAIRDFVQLAQEKRIIPKLYWISGSWRDAFGQGAIDLVDYRGKMLSLQTPRTVAGLPLKSGAENSRPLLVAPVNLFGMPNADLTFAIKEDSVYSRFWQGYPARRVQPALPTGENGLSASLVYGASLEAGDVQSQA